MKPTLPIVLAVVLLTVCGARFFTAFGRMATPPPAPETRLELAASGDGPRFATIDVTLDSGASGLAAYQVELSPMTSARDVPRLTFVAIEGGEHAAFVSPPEYDPEALRGAGERLVIAALATPAVKGDLPTGSTRVARVHVMIEGAGSAVVRATLIAAGAAGGARGDAVLSVSAGGGEQVLPGGSR